MHFSIATLSRKIGEIRAAIMANLSVDTANAALIHAQYSALSNGSPVLYIILAANAASMTLSIVDPGRPLLTIIAPCLLFLVCVVRAIIWLRRGNAEVPLHVAIARLSATRNLAGLLSIAFAGWGLLAFPAHDPYLQAQVIFFLGLTTISCIICLTRIRAATIVVSLVGLLTLVPAFYLIQNGHFAVEALNLAFVGTGILRMVFLYNRDFTRLIASQQTLQRQHQDMQALSLKDSLTGLQNRRALKQRLTASLSGGGGISGEGTALMFVDLDGFKEVNDAYGHEVGDKLLKIVAKECEQLCPAGSAIFRLGGDEFAVLVSSDDGVKTAKCIGQSLILGLRKPIQIGDRTIQVGASIGIAWSLPGNTSPDELIRRADVTMYHVKAHGKSNVEVYTPALDAERERRQDIEDDIKDGLRRDEFEVAYQPIVDAETHEVVSVEALLRWPRRTDGALGPAEFIPIAESSGLINALGAFVLRRACEDMLEFPRLKLSVNVSPAQFRDPAFESNVAQILESTGFPANRLELEITEGYLITQPERAVVVIRALQDLGIAISLDDFGTGYTSIGYLEKYRFSRIKIDKSLIDRIGVDTRADVLISGIVYMAKGLDMHITAEGVEVAEQLPLLRVAGCNSLQGFYFSRPVPLDGLADCVRLRHSAAQSSKRRAS